MILFFIFYWVGLQSFLGPLFSLYHNDCLHLMQLLNPPPPPYIADQPLQPLQPAPLNVPEPSIPIVPSLALTQNISNV